VTFVIAGWGHRLLPAALASGQAEVRKSGRRQAGGEFGVLPSSDR
jgi:hypothetical protein